MSPKFLEIESPVNLEPGQNFYEQPPFEKILNKSIKGSEAQLPRLREILTAISKTFGHKLNPKFIARDLSLALGGINRGKMNPSYFASTDERISIFDEELHPTNEMYDVRVVNLETPDHIRRYLIDWAQNGRTLRGRIIAARELGPYLRPLSLTGKALSEYPHWTDYLGHELDRSFYKMSGEPKDASKKQGDFIAPRTYAHWVSEKLQREKDLISGGIELVFPQDFSTGTDLTTPLIPNRKMGKMRWKILSASELIRPR